MRVGVIGAGSMGKNHLRLCSELPEYDLVGFADPNPKTEKYAEQYATKAYPSVEALLPDVEAVVVAAPSSLHKNIGLAVAVAGKHALIEKPLALNSADAKELVAAFDAAGRSLMVGHVERFNPVVEVMKNILQEEEVIAIDIHRCSPWDGRITDANVIQDLMIHDVDLLVNVLCDGPIADIHSSATSAFRPDLLEYVQSSFRFQNGIVASVTASCVTEDKIRSILVHCKKSLVRADLLNKTLEVTRKTNYYIHEEDHANYRQENITEKVFVTQVEPLRQELLNFALNIRGGEPLMVDARAAVRALEVLEQIENSCLNGRGEFA